MAANNEPEKGSTSPYVRIIQFLNSFAAFWIFIVMLIIVRDVVGRYFFGLPMPGAPEIVSLSVVSIAFLQFPYTLMVDRHVSSKILVTKFPSNVNKILEITGWVFGAIIFSLVAYSAWALFYRAFIDSHFEGSLVRIPSSPVRFIIFLGSIAMVGEYIRKIYLFMVSKKCKLVKDVEEIS